MGLVVLLCILVLVVFGCVCVVWAARGGPRWVRGVAAVTTGLGEVVRVLAKSSKRSGRGNSGFGSDSGGDGGSD
ncbi:hypothetical protein DI272_24435 [Streptomyces sp. Act143]|uniref:hypothetical protein n=1 Tax=Streptomyces sp. Act143 TaxID=2200760 RepID=UPI000D675FF1|nr:hypothetical protein [Streptomyces sp. Act143]PWI16963.1 hypothetical protein DI272_24435 [Streptomyces sp. Act143]